jgi:hypothetical protein
MLYILPDSRTTLTSIPDPKGYEYKDQQLSW